jgi:hypothetical protein
LIANGDYWMAGEDAVSQGFADETFNEVTQNLQIAARLDTNVYKNIPAVIRAQLKTDPETPEDSKTFFQTQFAEMKKFFTDIVNAIKGVKPVEGTPITNQIADAVTTPFEKLADEIEGTITNKVTEAIKPVNDSIAAQVATAVTASMDFGKEGPAKTAIDAAVKVAVDAMAGEMNGKITALETTNAGLKKKNDELELEITNMKGGKSTGNKEEENVPKPVGSWN